MCVRTGRTDGHLSGDRPPQSSPKSTMPEWCSAIRTRSWVSSETLAFRMPIPSARTTVWCSPPGTTLAWNAGPSTVPLTGGQLITKPAGVSPTSSGSLLSETLTWTRCSGLAANSARGLGGLLTGVLAVSAALVWPSRNAVRKVLAVAGAGARRPWHDTTGRYSTISPDQNVGNVARKDWVWFCKLLTIKGAETVSMARPSTRYRTLPALDGFAGRTPTVTDTPWRCSVVRSGAGASGVEYHISSPSFASRTMPA